MANRRICQKNLNTLVNSVYNYNTVRQTSYGSKNIVIMTIIVKWRKKTLDYICNYNLSKKWAKKVQQTVLR